jgi:cytoskeletal protein CcmA (bactofilin family)
MAYRPSEPGMFTPSTMMNAPTDDTAEGFSVIDRHSQFDGTFAAKRDLRIEGEVKGTIECMGTLFIAQGAVVAARVEAENITVAGDLSGEVACRGRLQVMPSGRLRGKVQTKTLVVNEGAYYEGEVEMPTTEARTTPPRALPGAAAPRVATPAAAAAPAAATPAVATAPAPSATTSSTGEVSRTFIRRFGGPETAWEGGEGDGEPEKDEA